MTMRQLDLAPVGNCAISSLVDRNARHVWHCHPRLDGDPVFNALINGDEPEGGFMDVVLRDQVRSEQTYVRNTAVLETILEDRHGARVRVYDLAPRFERFGRVFRPPMLVRRIEPMSGHCRIKVRIRPTYDHGAVAAHPIPGSNHIRYTSPGLTVRVTTDMPITFLLQEVEFVLDRAINIFLAPDETLPDKPDTFAREVLEETTSYWRAWVRGLAVPFDWQDAVIRAAITLKLCSFEDSGGIIAALTTSLPESANSGRNWDYRFCWLRDAFFTVNALNRLGATRTMENYIRYLLAAVLGQSGAPMAPLYPIVPGSSLTEIEATALQGFRGMGPVRIGNAASTQRQNDVYGSLILATAQMFWDGRLPSPGGPDLYRLLKPIAKRASKDALKPDAGIWEFRGRQRVHTFSAAMCWAALHRMGLIAGRVGQQTDAADWQNRAATLKHEILTQALHADGWFAGSFGGSEIDASLLLLPEIGFVPASDTRFTRTIQMVEKRLLRNGFVMRYDEADDFGPPDSAFLVCTFWYVDALAATGRREQALELFENILARRNHVGLLSEDVDPHNGTLWGNFPQTYSMVGLILSAMRLSRSWEEGLWGAS
ncbi:glycoside hydrolase family 15 protein [Vineibacter terrae]|nr:glycoside hydrolase family 15 protein [Vineibacter terrae]